MKRDSRFLPFMLRFLDSPSILGRTCPPLPAGPSFLTPPRHSLSLSDPVQRSFAFLTARQMLEIQKALRKVPVVELTAPTMVLVGAPNVTARRAMALINLPSVIHLMNHAPSI